MKNLIYAILLCIPLSLLSQKFDSDNNPILTAASFLNESYDARGVGIGNSGVSTLSDINSMFWNPAKYAFIKEDQTENKIDYPKDLGFSISNNRGYFTLTENTLNFNFTTYKVIGKQTIAASFRYHRWGDIYLTDRDGYLYGIINPLEFSIDAAYSRKISKVFSLGTAIRYIHSDQFGEIEIEGTKTQIGRSIAIDLALLYRKGLKIKNIDRSIINFGLNISNIGNKISYIEEQPHFNTSDHKDFIPTNLRLGGSFIIEKEIHGFTISADLNKLLVPTSPIYYQDSLDNNGDRVIYKGKDPNVNVFKGMIQSFYDAPNGFKEEMQEIYYGVGFEYWYDRFFAFRAGYFLKHENKGHRKNINLGVGIRYKFIAFDVAYSIIPDKRRDAEGNLTYQRNNWYINLIFQINTIKKPEVKND